MPQELASASETAYLGEAFTLVPAATGRSGLRERYRQPLAAIMVGGGAGAADRLREHRQPAARARHRATPRVQHPRGARRVAVAHRAAAARREPPPLGAGAILGLAFAQWGSRLLVRQLSTSVNTSSSTCRSTGASSGSRRPSRSPPRCCSGWRLRCAARASSRTTRSKRKDEALLGEARFGLGSLLVVGRSRSRWCSSSPPACSCGRSPRSRRAISGSSATRCSSPPSTRCQRVSSRPRASSCSGVRWRPPPRCRAWRVLRCRP